MAKPTHHSALEGMGFKLAGVQSVGSGSGNSVMARHHYVLTRSNVGLTPLDHHVFVDEFMNNPGKYNVHYRVAQGQEPYSGKDFDKLSRHKANAGSRGASDPIRDIMSHHTAVTNAINNRKPPALRPVTPGNVHTLTEGLDSWTPWESSGRNIKTQLRRSPDYRGLTSFNSVTKKSDAFDDIVSGNNYSGNCAMCGKAVRDIPESSFRDDKLYQVHPEDETSDMHGPPANLCGTCSVNPDVTTAIRKNPKSFGWHWNDQGVPGCPECGAHLMDQADEDLRP